MSHSDSDYLTDTLSRYLRRDDMPHDLRQAASLALAACVVANPPVWVWETVDALIDWDLDSAKSARLRALLTAAGCPDAASAVTVDNADDWALYLLRLDERRAYDG